MRKYDDVVSFYLSPVMLCFPLLQKYLNDTRNTSTGDANEVVSGFPTFQLEDEDFLGYFCPGGYFACHPKFGK